MQRSLLAGCKGTLLTNDMIKDLLPRKRRGNGTALHVEALVRKVFDKYAVEKWRERWHPQKPIARAS